MTEPCLNLGEIGVVVECIGGGGRSHRVGFRLESKGGRIVSDEPVNAIRRDGVFQGATGAAVSKRAKQRSAVVVSVSGGVQIIVDEIGGKLVQRDEANFLALAFDL